MTIGTTASRRRPGEALGRDRRRRLKLRATGSLRGEIRNDARPSQHTISGHEVRLMLACLSRDPTQVLLSLMTLERERAALASDLDVDSPSFVDFD
jgi:hypothetical protein